MFGSGSRDRALSAAGGNRNFSSVRCTVTRRTRASPSQAGVTPAPDTRVVAYAEGADGF